MCAAGPRNGVNTMRKFCVRRATDPMRSTVGFNRSIEETMTIPDFLLTWLQC